MSFQWLHRLAHFGMHNFTTVTAIRGATVARLVLQR
jgi:hypothetical protein